MINIELFNTLNNPLDRVFNRSITENGDTCFTSTGNLLLDILFNTEYFSKMLPKPRALTISRSIVYDDNYIGSTFARLVKSAPNSDTVDMLYRTMLFFAMFVRDPRFGLGRRDLGRYLLWLCNADTDYITTCGRFDDLYLGAMADLEYAIEAYWEDIKFDNGRAKKWAPRFNTIKEPFAKLFCQILKLQEKDYRKAIKCDTTEKLLSCHEEDKIVYEHIPSLAMLKYYNCFQKDPRFIEYIENVKTGKQKLNVSTTTVYDIYRNRTKIEADLFFDKLEKINISCIPILDTSGSMWDGYDSIGKAVSIAYYLAKCSSYCNNQVVSFSSHPQLITIKEKNSSEFGRNNTFCRELNSLYTGDCSNTDFQAVIYLLQYLDEFPDYFIVLSDMQFDYGSNKSKDDVMEIFKTCGVKTKIVWWNFNSREMSTPETDSYGNIFMSGYSPMLLKYLENGFNGKQFLNNLLSNYSSTVGFNM